MRKILFIICWALAGVGLYSCSLDEPSYGKTTSDNYYQKESDIEQALTGAYLQLRTTWNEYALNHYFVGDCSTDDALKGKSIESIRVLLPGHYIRRSAFNHYADATR